LLLDLHTLLAVGQIRADLNALWETLSEAGGYTKEGRGHILIPLE
jgi:hypothetical protein